MTYTNRNKSEKRRLQKTEMVQEAWARWQGWFPRRPGATPHPWGETAPADEKHVPLTTFLLQNSMRFKSKCSESCTLPWDVAMAIYNRKKPSVEKIGDN